MPLWPAETELERTRLKEAKPLRRKAVSGDRFLSYLWFAFCVALVLNAGAAVFEFWPEGLSWKLSGWFLMYVLSLTEVIRCLAVICSNDKLDDAKFLERGKMLRRLYGHSVHS